MDAPLARHLPRFFSSSSPPLLPPPLAGFEEEAFLTMLEPEIELEPEPSVTMTVADFEAQLLEAGASVRRELEVEQLAAQDEAEARHASEMATAVAAAEAVRDAEQGAAIASQIAAAVDAMREAVSHDIARALQPLLEEAVVARTVAAAAAAVASAIADPDQPSLTLCGPWSLLTAIETALGSAASVAFTATDGDEVSVDSNAIHIETRLAQALSALADGDA